jgi:hypothetical protein
MGISTLCLYWVVVALLDEDLPELYIKIQLVLRSKHTLSRL